MNSSKILKDLEEIINGSIDPSMFPYAKGNSIRIGCYIVRCNKKGYWKVYNIQDNKLVTETFCKSSAVALAKSLSQGKESIKDIKEIDKDIQKWFNDCVFYKHTIRVTKDDIKRDVSQTRYEIAQRKTHYAKQRLDKYIYSN